MSASSDDLRFILELASRAPSHHNLQPWCVRYDDASVELSVDETRVRGALGGEAAAWLALGAFAENAVVAARARGLKVDVAVAEEEATSPLVRLLLARDDAIADDGARLAARAARARETNRRAAHNAPLPEGALASLRAAVATSPGFAFLPVLDDEVRSILAALLAEGAALIGVQRAIHAEATGSTRYTRADAERTRDGLDVDTLELSPEGRAFLERSRDFDTFRSLVSRDALAEGTRRVLEGSPCLGVLVAPSAPTRLQVAVEAGRVLARVWNAAAAASLALHPSGALFLFSVDPLAAEPNLPDPSDRELLSDLHDDVRTLLDIEGDAQPYFAFRLFVADPATTRSLRRPVDAFATPL